MITVWIRVFLDSKDIRGHSQPWPQFRKTNINGIPGLELVNETITFKEGHKPEGSKYDKQNQCIKRVDFIFQASVTLNYQSTSPSTKKGRTLY